MEYNLKLWLDEARVLGSELPGLTPAQLYELAVDEDKQKEYDAARDQLNDKRRAFAQRVKASRFDEDCVNNVMFQLRLVDLCYGTGTLCQKSASQRLAGSIPE